MHHALCVQRFAASLMLGNLKFQGRLSQLLLWGVSVEEVATLSGVGGGGGGGGVDSLGWTREASFFLNKRLALALSFLLRCLNLGMILV